MIFSLPSTCSGATHLLDRSSPYVDQVVFIRSLFENRYVSALILDSAAIYTGVAMSLSEKSLFVLQCSLDESKREHEPHSIYISFRSLSWPNSYLRHEGGRIKLAKSDGSDLFKQDSTFKLIEYGEHTDIVAFQSANLPENYVAVDSQAKIPLVLTPLKQANTIDEQPKTSLFNLLLPSEEPNANVR